MLLTSFWLHARNHFLRQKNLRQNPTGTSPNRELNCRPDKKAGHRVQPFCCSRSLAGRANEKHRLAGAQLIGRHFARFLVPHHFVVDFLTVIEAAESGPLYGRDMNENIRTAIVRLNEAKTFGRIEPFNSASSHFIPSWCVWARKRLATARL